MTTYKVCVDGVDYRAYVVKDPEPEDWNPILLSPVFDNEESAEHFAEEINDLIQTVRNDIKKRVLKHTTGLDL